MKQCLSIVIVGSLYIATTAAVILMHYSITKQQLGVILFFACCVCLWMALCRPVSANTYAQLPLGDTDDEEAVQKKRIRMIQKITKDNGSDVEEEEDDTPPSSWPHRPVDPLELETGLAPVIPALSSHSIDPTDAAASHCRGEPTTDEVDVNVVVIEPPPPGIACHPPSHTVKTAASSASMLLSSIFNGYVSHKSPMS
jgi:hypothetical protein